MLLLMAGMIWSCDTHPANPTDTGNPDGQDTTDNPPDTTGDTSQVRQYGRLYFQSASSTRWQVSGPVSVNAAGIILADNQGRDTLPGVCRYDGMVNFDESINLTFLWEGGASGGTTYSFSISSDGDSWTELGYQDNGEGWQAAPFVFLLNWQEPVTFRFEFRLPPGGRARIPQVRGYGKD